MVRSDDSQRGVIEFLSKPETYGLAAGTIERYETHGAIVFLAGDKAYKLKRSVHFTYMDYSTPERRRQMCERELVVNRRTAPQLYLETRPIARDVDGQLRFGAADEPAILDWVVVMRRFDQDNLLEQLRQKQRLTPELFRLLAGAIAEFHQKAEIRGDYGGATGIAEVVAENITVLSSLAGYPFDSRQIDRFSDLCDRMLDRVGKILEERRHEGRVRRCHGDLHLNNICLIDGKPVLFDAIEFSEEFACIDVLYDLAFLLMDLDRHGLRGYANILLNRYLELTRDYEGIAGLPLFLSCRAAIRAHVAATTARLLTSQTQAESKLQEAKALFDRAIAYLEPAPARLVAIGGASGTGKSTLARNLAPNLGPVPGALVVRSDVVRKHLMGVDETTRLAANAYQPEVNLKVYGAIAELSSKVVATGHAVIADAVYGTAEERRQIEQAAIDAKVKFDGLWLEADPKLLQHRISARIADASDATVEVLREQLKFIERPQNWLSLNATGTPTEITADARRKLNL
jgi:aminoglycoside phosphotransferase family enzyme/predicted kinase